jgi:hypothetical protein
MLKQLAIVGPSVKDWSEAMLQARGVEGIRVLQGLKALASKHDATALNGACETAMSYGALRLRTIRTLLKSTNDVKQQEQFSRRASRDSSSERLFARISVPVSKGT